MRTGHRLPRLGHGPLCHTRRSVATLSLTHAHYFTTALTPFSSHGRGTRASPLYETAERRGGSLYTPCRRQSQGSSMGSVAQLVMAPRRVEEAAEEESGADAEGERTPREEEEDAAAAWKDEETGRVVEFTEEEAKRLERSFHRPAQKRVHLPEKDRTLLCKMIYKKFYQELVHKGNREAMQYQAGLEVTWIEEWAERAIAEDFQRKGKEASIGSPDFTDRVRRLIKRSVLERVDLSKPLSYIIGVQPFYGCDIVCRPPLLCPRPETEMWTHWLCQQYLKRATAPAQPLRVLDMCCGTGCIGVAMAKNVPAAHVTAVDLLPAAVDTAMENAAKNGIPPERFQAVQSDMFEVFFNPATKGTYPRSSLPHGRPDDAAEDSGRKGGEEAPAPPQIAEEHKGTYDIIVSNPPYVLPEQYVVLPLSILNWESKMALVGDDLREHQQYLYFKELCEYGCALLKPKHQRHPALRDAPNLVIEVGLQAHVVASIMERSGLFDDVAVHLDYSQQERWVTACSKH